MLATPRRLALLLALAALTPVRSDEPPTTDPLPPGARARLGSSRFRIDGHASALSLSADGRHLLVAAGDSLVVLDAEDGTEVRRFPLKNIGVMQMQFTADARLLAVLDHGGSLSVIDTATGAVRSRCDKINTRNRAGLDLTADGRLAAFGAEGFNEGKLSASVWDLTTGKRLSSVAVVQDHQVQVVLSADGKQLATWGRHLGLAGGARDMTLSQTIQLWDAASGKEVRKLTVASYTPADVAFAPDGKRLAVLEPGPSVGLWDLNTGQMVRQWAVRRGTHQVRFSPDGKYLTAGVYNGAAQVWELATGRRVAVGEGSQVVFLPGGRLRACGLHDQAIVVWDSQAGRVVTPGGGHTTAVTALAFRPDGKTLLSGGRDGVHWWDAASGKELRHRQIRSDERFGGGSEDFLLSPDGNYLASGSRHGHETQLTDLTSGEESFSVQGQATHTGTIGAFAEGGKVYATLGMSIDGAARATVVRVLDLATGEEKRSLKAPAAQQFSLALSPDGRRAALAASDFGRQAEGCARVWDVAAAKELTVIAHEGWVGGLTFSPDGVLLALAGAPQPPRVYDAATGGEWPRPEMEASNSAAALTFSRDGRLLASMVTGEDRVAKKVRVWEVVSGQVRTELTGHRGAVTALAFSPDGRTLATGSNDTTVLLWDLYGSTPASELSARQLEGLWTDLDGNGRRADQALGRLATAPAKAVALLKDHLPPAAGKSPEPAQVAAWIADLDGDDFEAREKASQELHKAGRAARAALTAALEAKPSPEKKRRLQELLDALKRTGPPPEMIRPMRALELLERLGTPEARRLVEELADGNPDAALTLEAQAVLRRLR